MMSQSSLVRLGICAGLHKEPPGSFWRPLIPAVVIPPTQWPWWQGLSKRWPPSTNPKSCWSLPRDYFLAGALKRHKTLHFSTEDITSPFFPCARKTWPVLIPYHTYWPPTPCSGLLSNRWQVPEAKGGKDYKGSWCIQRRVLTKTCTDRSYLRSKTKERFAGSETEKMSCQVTISGIQYLDFSPGACLCCS